MPKPIIKAKSDVQQFLSGVTGSTYEITQPLWKGPEVDGVSQSLLNGYMFDRERFRIQTIEGLQNIEGFNKNMEYGNMWHICEENLAANKPWDDPLTKYARELCKKNPTQQEEILKWYRLCKIQFPIYVDYWKDNPDVLERTPLFQELIFKLPYKIPSTDVTVFIRGKFDSVDIIGKGKNAGIFLQENKTKSDIDEPLLKRQVTYDLQTMTYLSVLTGSDGCLRPEILQYVPENLRTKVKKIPVKGIRYNVIRRPLSGGKGTIRQKGPSAKYPNGQSLDEYYKEVEDILKTCQPEYYVRFNVDLEYADIKKYQIETLNPCLYGLAHWYACVVEALKEGISMGEYQAKYGYCGHYRLPYGIYNPLADGRSTDLDHYLLTGSRTGLTRVETLFPEL